MSQLFILFEHAAGYSLFRVTEFEEISMLLPQVKASVTDIGKFRSIVELVAFKPFQTGHDALENINSISEGILHPDLQLFLETNVPKSKKKKQPVLLGVSDLKLASAINESMGMQCQHTGVVPEIIRGIRLHFQNLVSGFKGGSAPKAQLGLGHNYSRAKVKFNVNRVDNMIIQSICLLDQLDKDINLFAMRVREWYSYHFPELYKIVSENGLYAEVVGLIKDRKSMTEETVEQLRELLKDDAKTDHILEVAKSSMGMDISPIDLINIEHFATRVSSLIAYRKELMEYLKSRMHNVAPSLASLIGETVGARLISHAGSLTNLAKYPASTVQILGAEKALFRALKTRGNTPKYGLIFHSTFIGRAAKQNKGRISRFLANKCSLASRIDCFAEVPTEVFGQKLKQQVEDRLKFYETGVKPSKNIDVMSEAADEAAVLQEKLLKKQRKREKKELKKKQAEMQALGNSNFDSTFGNSTMELQQDSVIDTSLPNGLPLKKKKKKKNKLETDESLLEQTNVENGLPDETIAEDKPKKKRKRQELDAGEDVSIFSPDATTDEQPKKKKKKNKTQDASMEFESPAVTSPVKKKKKKHLSVEE